MRHTYLLWNLTFLDNSYQKVFLTFLPFRVYLPRKFEKFSIVLEKFAVNAEVRQKEGILYKGQGNHILNYRKILRIKFIGLENPCIKPYNTTGWNSRLFCHMIVTNKRLLLRNTKILGNYGLFNTLQRETYVKKVFKSFSCSI